MINHKFPNVEVIRETLRDLQAQGVTGRMVEDATGLGQPWQQAFRDGRTEDPRYTMICTLAEYMQENFPALFAQNIAEHAQKQG